MFQVSKIGSKSVEEFVSRFFLFKLAVGTFRSKGHRVIQLAISAEQAQGKNFMIQFFLVEKLFCLCLVWALNTTQ